MTITVWCRKATWFYVRSYVCVGSSKASEEVAGLAEVTTLRDQPSVSSLFGISDQCQMAHFLLLRLPSSTSSRYSCTMLGWRPCLDLAIPVK